MIHGAGNCYDEYKVLDEFGTKYDAAQTSKDHGSDPIPRKRLWKKQENHTIINNVVDELRMIESKKVSDVNHESLEFLESDCNDNELYQVENMSLNDTKKIMNDVSVRLNTKVHI